MKKILTLVAILSTAVLFAQNETSASFVGEYHNKGEIFKHYHFVLLSPQFDAEVIVTPKHNKVTFQFVNTALPKKDGTTTAGISEKFFEDISYALLSDVYEKDPKKLNATSKKKYFKMQGTHYLKVITLRNISIPC